MSYHSVPAAAARRRRCFRREESGEKAGGVRPGGQQHGVEGGLPGQAHPLVQAEAQLLALLPTNHQPRHRHPGLVVAAATAAAAAIARQLGKSQT